MAQAVGAIGVALLALAYIQKKRSTILAYNITSAIMWTAHFLLLAAPSGAALNALSIARASALYYEGRLNKRRIITLVLLLSAFGLASLSTWVDDTSILPLIAMTISTLALWQKNPQYIRLIMLASSPFWITYNILHGSIAGVIGECVVIISALIGLVKYRNLRADTAKNA